MKGDKIQFPMRKSEVYSRLGAKMTADAPLADLTNASYLFGDPFDEDGDIADDEDGDPADQYGDPDPLSAYYAISGDPADEYGDPKRRRLRKGVAIGAGVLGAGALAAITAAAVKKRRAKAAAAKNMLDRYASQQTIRKASMLQRNAGKIARTTPISFFSLRGAKLNSAPISPSSTFIADMFKNMLDRQNMDTPFLQETAIGTFAGGTWTATATGVPANRFFTALILQIGTNMLNAAPGTVINITAVIPTLSGNLVISSEPIIMTYEKGFDVRFMIFPWQLVANKAMPVLGQYNNANPIVFTVTGIPSASAVNLIVPGSLHPWTVGMRTSLI